MMATLSRWLVLSPLIILCVCCSSATGLRRGGVSGGHPESLRGQILLRAGDVAYLKLIDESFAIFHANPDVPNLTMVYQHDWDTFCEGATGPVCGSKTATDSPTPRLRSFKSLGSRCCNVRGTFFGIAKPTANEWASTTAPTATNISALVAPDGCLGDAVSGPGGIAYKTERRQLESSRLVVRIHPGVRGATG